jgi:hypothetical protein
MHQTLLTWLGTPRPMHVQGGLPTIASNLTSPIYPINAQKTFGGLSNVSVNSTIGASP